MPRRMSLIAEADARAARQLAEVLGEVRLARQARGVSQATVARVAGCSRQVVSAVELGRRDVGARRLARIAAAVGVDVAVRAYPGVPAVRDAGQLRLLGRLRNELSRTRWLWQTESPVAADTRDQRAFDALLSLGGERVAVEAVTTLVDAQAQVRSILLKQGASGVGCVVLVLADTRRNRDAVAASRPTLGPAFPLRRRAILGALQTGHAPAANGLVLL